MVHTIDIQRMIKEYESKITTIQKEADEKITKYRHAIKALKELPEYEEINNNTPLPIDDEKVSPRLTLNQKVKEVLKLADAPLTSRDLMNEVNNQYPDKEYEFPKWSGNFSTMYQKANSGIIKFEIDNMPVNLSAFYCLEEWIESDSLKDEYFKKLKDFYNLDI